MSDTVFTKSISCSVISSPKLMNSSNCSSTSSFWSCFSSPLICSQMRSTLTELSDVRLRSCVPSFLTPPPRSSTYLSNNCRYSVTCSELSISLKYDSTIERDFSLTPSLFAVAMIAKSCISAFKMDSLICLLLSYKVCNLMILF